MQDSHAEFYNIPIKTIEGKDQTMGEYQGKVLLIVNTASKCGFTSQYKGLEELHEKYKEQGLVVLGMPCNQFGGQEPASETEIQSFCELNFGVKFQLLKKGDVKGENQHPLYQYLLSHGKSKSNVKWNFEKFLVSKEGKVLDRFSSLRGPTSSTMTKAIEKALV